MRAGGGAAEGVGAMVTSVSVPALVDRRGHCEVTLVAAVP
jgi:hypothetical protein